MRPSRRRLLASLGAAATALAGCLGGSGAGASERVTNTPEPPHGPLGDAPLPADPETVPYQTTGSTGPVVTYFGNPKCPYCAEFALGSDRLLSLPAVVAEYVRPGRLRLRYRGVAYTPDGEPFLGPDAPRAVQAGLAVWETAPDDYWSYHECVAAHQPPESERWATADRLVAFAMAAGVEESEPVRAAVETDQFSDRLTATTEAFADSGADGTPTLVVDGTPYSPFERESLRGALEAVAT
ncbi:DsbA family protein [Halosegnis sp.]|uniref:DsbA family protein n=1 Tax=Halosegnis sp. TaxID=2864959 RepID=UPI0035D4DDA8